MWRQLKRLIKLIVYRPRQIKMGDGSLILLPRTINNPSAIEIGARTVIYQHSLLTALSSDKGISCAGRIIIGDDVHIGRYAQLLAMSTLTLESGTVLSEYVYINDTVHGFDPEAGRIMDQPMTCRGPIVIGENCFLGVGVTILSGVSLGAWTIVGARSVVTKSFPPYSMIAGAPARLIRTYAPEERAWIMPMENNHSLVSKNKPDDDVETKPFASFE